MKISHLIRNPKLVDISLAVVIGSLGFFINSMYFSFRYFAMAGNLWAQIWVEPVEHALVIATIPLYLSIGHIYWQEKRTRRELEKSNRLKDIFTDIMTHDLLNPAGIIKNSTELGLDDEKDPDKRKLLQMTSTASEKIISMIENASLLAKLESGEEIVLEEQDLGDILRHVAIQMEALADEKKMKIKITAEREFKAPVNPLIYDLFSNLIGNAIKYGSENSGVFVWIEADDPNWKISIADSGPGIPDEYKEGIFDRFTRIQKHGVKGTGLGLAIAKRVAEAHRGKVWVEDNPDGGSIFYVKLPKERDKHYFRRGTT